MNTAKPTPHAMTPHERAPDNHKQGAIDRKLVITTALCLGSGILLGIGASCVADLMPSLDLHDPFILQRAWAAAATGALGFYLSTKLFFLLGENDATNRASAHIDRMRNAALTLAGAIAKVSGIYEINDPRLPMNILKANPAHADVPGIFATAYAEALETLVMSSARNALATMYKYGFPMASGNRHESQVIQERAAARMLLTLGLLWPESEPLPEAFALVDGTSLANDARTIVKAAVIGATIPALSDTLRKALEDITSITPPPNKLH